MCVCVCVRVYNMAAAVIPSSSLSFSVEGEIETKCSHFSLAFSKYQSAKQDFSLKGKLTYFLFKRQFLRVIIRASLSPFFSLIIKSLKCIGLCDVVTTHSGIPIFFLCLRCRGD